VIPCGLNQLTFTILPLSGLPFVFGSPVCGDGPVLEEDAPWGDASWTLGIWDDMAETNWAISNSAIGETPLFVLNRDPEGDMLGSMCDNVGAESVISLAPTNPGD
jgi:hypothetical protein